MHENNPEPFMTTRDQIVIEEYTVSSFNRECLRKLEEGWTRVGQPSIYTFLDNYPTYESTKVIYFNTRYFCQVFEKKDVEPYELRSSVP